MPFEYVPYLSDRLAGFIVRTEKGLRDLRLDDCNYPLDGDHSYAVINPVSRECIAVYPFKRSAAVRRLEAYRLYELRPIPVRHTA